MVNKELVERQLKLEYEAVEMGINDYRKALRKARQRKEGVDEFRPELALIHRMLEPMVNGRTLDSGETVNGLYHFMTSTGRAGHLVKARQYIKDGDPWELAYLTLQTSLNQYFSGVKLTAMSHALGANIMDR